MIPLNHYLILSAILFAIGTTGVFLRRNLITMLLSVEIMLNAVENPTISSVTLLGEVLFTRYMFAFEVTSILIIASMVGAVVLARKREE